MCTPYPSNLSKPTTPQEYLGPFFTFFLWESLPETKVHTRIGIIGTKLYHSGWHEQNVLRLAIYSQIHPVEFQIGRQRRSTLPSVQPEFSFTCPDGQVINAIFFDRDLYKRSPYKSTDFI